MEILFKSPFFSMVSNPENLQEVNEIDLSNAYNEFVRLIIEISTTSSNGILPFFRLNYARVEFLQIQKEKYTGELVKKMFQ